MNFQDWYTDRMDIFRLEEHTAGSITKQKRVPVAQGVPCRVYQTAKPSPRLGDTAAETAGADKLMCALDVELRAGDELLVLRRGSTRPIRYFAGAFRPYGEPFGAVLPGLAHQEGNIWEEERS